MSIDSPPIRAIVLLAGQDALFAAQLRSALEERSIELMHCTKVAVGAANDRLCPDVLILGLGAANLESVEAMRALHTAPIIVIGPAPDADGEIVAALLDAGADDYVRDFTSAKELASHVAAVLRRRSDDDDLELRVGPLSIHRQQRVATVDGQPLDLTQTEFRLIAALARQAGRVQFHQDLLDRVWGSSGMGCHTLAVVISRLRRKLRGIVGLSLETVSGVGYRLREVSAIELQLDENLPLQAIAG